MKSEINGATIAAVLIGVPLALALIALLMIPSVLWHAFVLTKLWAWFIVPMDGPNLSLRSAIGVSAIAGMLTKQYHPAPKDTKWYEGFAYVFGAPACALLIGWCAR